MRQKHAGNRWHLERSVEERRSQEMVDRGEMMGRWAPSWAGRGRQQNSTPIAAPVSGYGHPSTHKHPSEDCL